MTKRYDKLIKSRYRKGLHEINDCTVIALAITCRVSYKKAHEVLKEHGRTNRRGLAIDLNLKAISSLGFKVNTVDKLRQGNGSRFTPMTISKRLKRGYYLLRSDGHVFALVNGVVENWVNGRRHRILSAYKITRSRSNETIKAI